MWCLLVHGELTALCPYLEQSVSSFDDDVDVDSDDD